MNFLPNYRTNLLTQLVIYSGISGITVFIGGLLANYFNHHIKETPVKFEIIHTLMSFGAGIILSAVALVLVPEGMEKLELVPMGLTFLLGAILFMLIDLRLSKQKGQTATLLAMMMDFVPEAIALGAVFATNKNSAILLAVFIGLQNLPEAFNSYRDLIESGMKVKKTLILFFFLSFFGIISSLLGHFLLTDSPKTTAYLMTFAGGGILYLLIQDIIPESKLENKHAVSLAAAMGFLIGIIGEMVV